MWYTAAFHLVKYYLETRNVSRTVVSSEERNQQCLGHQVESRDCVNHVTEDVWYHLLNQSIARLIHIHIIMHRENITSPKHFAFISLILMNRLRWWWMVANQQLPLQASLLFYRLTVNTNVGYIQNYSSPIYRDFAILSWVDVELLMKQL